MIFESTLRLIVFSFLFLLIIPNSHSQNTDNRIYEIIDAVSADRLEKDIRKLAGFGTRNTFSDTISQTRGIGAARRWIKAEYDKISSECNNCLDVFYQKDLVTTKDGARVPHDAWVVNVVAVQKGTNIQTGTLL